MWLLLHAANAACLDSVAVHAQRVEIDLVASTNTERWTLRFDPSECPEGVELPDVLAGASKIGGPTDLEEGGAEQQFERISPMEASSDTLRVAEGVPAGRTRVYFRFGRSIPLQVFTDDSAHRHRVGNDLVVWWDPHIDNDPTLIWTTWNDWVAAGSAMQAPVLRSIPSTRDLGSLGRSLRGADLTSLVSRLDATIDLEPPEQATGWQRGRDAEQVLGSGRGTPSERGLILMAMLKGAGIKATPAWFSTTDDDGPRTLPAPHLLPHPAIAVRLRNETVYIDPGVRGARPPTVPARMMGGRVLEAGRHLVIPNDTAAPRGEVRIGADLQVSETGRVVFDGKIIPTGSAEQALRAAFTGLEAQQWPGIVREWLTPKGELRDLVVGVNGLDGMAPFTVDVRFTYPDGLKAIGDGYQGEVLDPLAPGLASLLPQGIAIAERLKVVPPATMFALTGVRPSVERRPELILNRSLATKQDTLTLSHDWHVLTQQGSEAAIEDATGATRLLLFPKENGPAKRAAKELDLPEDDQAVIRSLLLYRLGLAKPASKQLKKLGKERTVEEIAALLARYATVGDARPWEDLVTLVESDAQRIAVIHGLEAIGDRRLGWQLATALTQSQDPLTRTRAFVQVARLQGPSAPDAQADPDGNRAWRDPIKLLQFAHKQAGEHKGVTRLPLIETFLRSGRPMEADELLDDRGDTPADRAAEAEFGAVTGVFGVDVLGLIESALDEAPWDPEVRGAVGRAQAALGRRRQGVRNVLLAAELIGNDHTRWLTAARYAAEMGDLKAALYAARRASDLAPNFVEPALTLQYYARLTGDDEALQLGIDRLGEEMHPNLVGDLTHLIEQEPSVELALMRHHRDVVESDKSLLRRRAALHFERAMFEDAALDGSLLLDAHRDATGARYLLAGVTSRFWHAEPFKVLGRNSWAADAKVAKMDIQIVTGQRVYASGDRYKTWRQLLRNPKKLASDAATWPVGMKDFEHPAPAGYEENRNLSKVRGVLAWSSEALQRTILRTERATGDLPPPISDLYENGPTVLSTDRGAAVVRLQGGAIPVYAGVTLADGQDVIGLGLNAASARDAVLAGIGALEVPK